MTSWALHALVKRAVNGASLVVNVAATVGSTALLVEPTRMGRTLRDLGAQVEPLVRAATGVTLEAVGAEPARRCSSNAQRSWIEVRGLGDEDGSALAATVLDTLRGTPGVESAFINRRIERVVVAVAPDGPSPSRLCKIVADAERRHGVAGRRTPAAPLPGDDTVLVGRMVGATAALAGLGVSIAGSALRWPGVPNLVAVPTALFDYVPQLRRELDRLLGQDGADLFLASLNALNAALTLEPTTAVADAATRAMLAVEAWNGRTAWSRHEPELALDCAYEAAEVLPTEKPLFTHGFSERYAVRSVATGAGVAAAMSGLTQGLAAAATAMLVSIPKPMRASREAFGCALTRGMASSHDALVIRPRALRLLDRVDAVVVDPRMLYSDGLIVSRVRGVPNGGRTKAWAAARAALQSDGLKPGWHDLSTIAGGGSAGQALISPLRDPLATALVAEARKSKRRVVSLDDDGLRSLAKGFDELRVVDASIDDALMTAVAELQADGATVALLTTAGGSAARIANLTIGLVRPQHALPWGADVMVTDLAGAWRVLHALPAARTATEKGIEVSVSSSLIGALMLIPGVAGSPTMSVNLGATATLWSGYRSGAAVFSTDLPPPEPGQDWHALTAQEVQGLLPRPSAARPGESGDARQSRLAAVPLLGSIDRAAVSTWHYGRDFFAAMRSDLDDPITPILATGAVASALLGSPLDAVLVGGVLLTNAALSSQQQLRAERLLHRLLVVQDPLARRRVGALEDDSCEDVPAKRLRLGDIIEVRSGEIVPADGRILHATNVELDESLLTGESLPVTKQTAPTPGAPLAERACMVYAGATVVAGSVLAIVTAAGPNTEMRRAMAMNPARAREIGMERQLRRITRRALPWSLTGGALVGLLSVVRGTPLRQAIASSVSVIVAAIPEGLPLVVTLGQLAAARRLSAHSVLIRNTRSIEALARLDVVCFDKTGTLSENRLEVKSVRPLNGFGVEAVLDAALSTAYARHTHRVEHVTDEAVERAAEDPVWRPDGWRAGERPTRQAFLPFQSGRPFAAALAGTRLTIKGAPEAVSTAIRGDVRELVAIVEDMAAQGLRVLAVAERELSPSQAAAAASDADAFERLCLEDLNLVGLLGLADIPRPQSAWVLGELTRLGIGVRLITGDHPVTAVAAADDIGLDVTPEQVITGSEWQLMSADERSDAVTTRLVFARMTPEDKVEVVQTLEQLGRVTAMVGDGANDAAAIRAATVGIGVAGRGSDPARTAADVVLLDGRIEALLDAIAEGKQLWRRVQSAVSMLLGGNTGEVCFALLTSLLTGKSALNARQMLLVNMMTDALPASALAVSTQTSSETVDFDESAVWRAIAIRGATTATGATLAWVMASMTGTQRRAATVALIGLVSTQLAQTLVDSHGRLVVLTAVGSFVVLGVVVSTPGVSQAFGCTPVGPLGWGQALFATAVSTALLAFTPALVSAGEAAYSSMTRIPARNKRA